MERKGEREMKGEAEVKRRERSFISYFGGKVYRISVYSLVI